MATSGPAKAHGNPPAWVPTIALGFADTREADAKVFNVTETERLLAIALSRWESEGGSDAQRLAAAPGDEPLDSVPLSNAEMVQLRIRVIALENLVIALLAEAPVRQLALAREMSTYISPRPGYTPHPLTLRAADEMLSLVDRADRFLYPPTS
jgi:hypothetical protein